MFSKLKDKLKFWWEGELQEPELEDLFSGDEKSFENKEPPDVYKHRLSAIIVRTIIFFWQKHWFKILSLVIALSASIALWSKV